MNLFKILLTFSIIYSFSFGQVKALENKILLKIDNEIITSLDVLNEIEYLKLINKDLENIEKKKIFEISKNSIVREKIKIIELRRYIENLEVEQEYSDLLIKDFFKRLNIENKDMFKKFLKKKGLEIDFIKKKIEIEILWNQLIVSKFTKEIKLDENKIRDEILKNNIQKELLLSEIVFNLEDNQKLEEKFLKIKKDIEKSNFSNAALIHSISNSANNGGTLGWIKLNSLNKKIKDNIKNTSNGNFTNPIVIPGGFLILKIEDQRETDVIENIDKEIEIIKNEIANKQLNQLSNVYFNKIKKEVQFNEY